MQKILKISEAVAIALHACALLGKEKGKRIEAREIAKQLDVSYDHLSKVLQRLAKGGIVKSLKGPSGGFMLADAPDKIYLKDIYELMEGHMKLSSCLFGKEICAAKKCVLGDLISKINNDVIEYFSKTKISDL